MSDVIVALSRINDVIFVSLVNTTLQMTVVISLIALLIRVFHIKSATIRYSLWLFALFAIIALPILTPFIPRMELTGLRHQRASGYGLDESMSPGMETDGAGELSEADGSVTSAGAARVTLSREMDASIINPVSIAYFIWCVGTVFMAYIIIRAYRNLAKLRSGSTDVNDSMTIDMLSVLKDKIGVGRSVALKASSDIYTPMSIGFLSPVIVIPNSVINDSSNEQLEMILTHELAHIKRNDYLMNLLQNILRVVFFFHPLFHLMKRNLARECEHICDDWVINVTQRRRVYADCIVNMLEKALHRPASIPVTIAMAERKQDIPGRIDMIVDRSRRLCTNVPKKALIALLLIGCLSLPIIGGIGFIRFAGSAPTSVKAQIAFHTNRDGNITPEIYTMDADGANQHRLTNNFDYDGLPSWSPDGQKIAFDSERDGNREIYAMAADGTNQHRLTDNPAYDGVPSWSPDGQRIAFVSERDGNAEIYVMDTDGANQRRLTNNPSYDLFPSWSPDGQRITFDSGRDNEEGEIYIIDADGTNQRRLTNNLAYDGEPSWSPDGQKIAFMSDRDNNVEIYTIDIDGRNSRRITNSPSHDASPSWSPDGQKIAFMSNRDGNTEVYSIDIDGNNPKNLTKHHLFDGYPDWFDPAFAFAISPAGKLKTTWGKIKAWLRPQ